MSLPDFYGQWQQARENGRQRVLQGQIRETMPAALSGKQDAVSRLLTLDPTTGVQVQSHVANQQKAQQEAVAAQRAEIGKLAAGVVRAHQAGDPMALQGAYGALRARAMELNPSDDLPEAFDPNDLADIHGLVAMGGQGLPEAEQFTLAPGSARYDAQGRLIASQPFNDKPEFQLYESADGPVWLPKPGRDMGSGPSMGGAPAPAGGVSGGGAQVLGNAYGDAIQSVESAGNPNAVSPKGARGLMQLMPATAREVERALGMPAGLTDRDPQANREAGEWYFQQQLQRFGDPRLALAAYNGGPNRLAGHLQAVGGDVDAALARMPSETRAYVPKVMGRMGGGMGAIPIQGVRPKAKQAPPSPVQQRQQMIRELEASGVRLSEAEKRAVMLTGRPPAPTPAKTAQAQGMKPAQLANVERGIARIDKALKGLNGAFVNTGPLDQLIVGRTPAGQELEAAVGSIQESLLALTRVPGMGAQSDLEAKIAGLKFPSLGMDPEVNRRTLVQLKAFVEDLKRQVAPAPAAAAPANRNDDPLGIL